MKLDYSALQKAFGQLKTSMEYYESEQSRRDDGLRLQFRSSVIQSFEYTYELAIKMIRRQLDQIVANPSELREMNFLDVMRGASEAGLIKSVAAYKVFREKRNMTSHAYDEDKAAEVLEAMDEFVSEINFLLDELHRRNA